MDDYAYINARIRAMQGRLFDRPRYETLLAQEDTEGLLEFLKDSPYGLMGTDFKSAPILMDEMFRQDLTWTLSKLRRMILDRPRVLMEAVLLRMDTYNLKTVLRGKMAHAPIEEILASTMPVGSLDEVALAELARAPTLRAMADTLETWRAPFARPLREELRVLGDADTLQPLEFELDRFTFAKAFQMVADGDDNDQAVRAYLRLLADKANLLTALRYVEERSVLSGEPVAGEPVALPNAMGRAAMGQEAGRHYLDVDGRLTRPHYQTVTGARDLRHGLSLLAGTPYGWLADRFAGEEPVTLPRVERRLDRWLLREAIGLARQDPLGIAVTMAYIERKVNEVRNLRMIMRGKASGMGAEQITEWLIV